MGMRAVKVDDTLRQKLARALGRPAAARAGGDVVVVVMGPDGAVAGRPRAPGRGFTLAEVTRWVQAAVEELSMESVSRPAPELSAGEAALLDRAGFARGRPGAPGALERSRVEYEVLLHESPTLEAAARELRVSTSRLRQRLSARERTLLGVKDGRSWRIPRFQFQARGRLVRGLERVLPSVRRDAHPLAIRRWFAMPHPDLTVGDAGRPVSPLAWLAAGHPPATVADLAREI
ncbi:MAG: hypothetical protein HYY18_17220 [Planctomycetes bacterium]|nr:hypothetical protein [Planctomycetota bacterium]